MPSKARCSKYSLSCGTKENLISCSSCPTAAARTSPRPGPTLSRRHRVRSHHARLSLLHQTCCGYTSVLIVCCRRIEAGPTTDQNSPTQESHHATSATGAVEGRT